jgi:hypothetical protein
MSMAIVHMFTYINIRIYTCTHTSRVGYRIVPGQSEDCVGAGARDLVAELQCLAVVQDDVVLDVHLVVGFLILEEENYTHARVSVFCVS